MKKRFVAIWFPQLVTDWLCIRKPELRGKPFVLCHAVHGKMMVTAASEEAAAKGVSAGMPLADARAFIPSLLVFDDQPALAGKLLKKLCAWCIRFTPTAAVSPDGLIFNATGCTHLWGGDAGYLTAIHDRLSHFGYKLRLAIADTIGAAWAVAHFGANKTVVASGAQADTLLPLPPAALRLEADVVERLHKLGLSTVGQFMNMPRTALRRRFGAGFLKRLDQALGNEDEFIESLQPPEPFDVRLNALEPVATRTGIEIALKELLLQLCCRLQKEGKGLRQAVFKCYRIDGKVEQLAIGTLSASGNEDHLFKLFELNLQLIEPALGIELFTLCATQTEDVKPLQDALWKAAGSIEDKEVAEMLDRVKTKLPDAAIHRYLPAEHYWPERSFRVTTSLHEKAASAWPTGMLRPIILLKHPATISVTAPVPDYPPMMFTYKGRLHKITKADGPERIETEWWLDGSGLHRDYYCVEDEEGKRYWIFRAGHYTANEKPRWFIHGFFA